MCTISFLYVCVSRDMTDAVSALLVQAGVPEQRILLNF
jgi:ferredoxin-NADP reductase